MMKKYGKVYRDLEEQIEKDKSDIIILKRLIGNYGMRVVGLLSSTSELPDPETYTGAFGDCYAVGDYNTPPYEIYAFVKPLSGYTTPLWITLGQFPLKGEPGDPGEDGADGTSSMWYAGSGYPTASANEGDMYLRTDNGYVYRYESGAWAYKLTIIGPVGPAPTLTAGTATATTGNYGDPPQVACTLTGSSGSYTMNWAFEIPEGAPGQDGADGADGIGVNDLDSIQVGQFNQGETIESSTGFSYGANVALDVDGTTYVANGSFDIPLHFDDPALNVVVDAHDIAVVDIDYLNLIDNITYNNQSTEFEGLAQAINNHDPSNKNWTRIETYTFDGTTGSHDTTFDSSKYSQIRMVVRINQGSTAYGGFVYKVNRTDNSSVNMMTLPSLVATSSNQKRLLIDFNKCGQYIDVKGSEYTSNTNNRALGAYPLNWTETWSDVKAIKIGTASQSTQLIPSGSTIEVWAR